VTVRQSLIGQRVRLDRPGQYEADAEHLLAYFERNKDHLERWSPTRKHNYYSKDYWATAVAEAAEKEGDDKALEFIVREQSSSGGTVIGMFSFSEITRDAFQACYLGYSIDQAHEGKGLMQEALALAIDYAFNEMTLHRIMANYQPSNTRSAKTLEALDFNVEGLAKKYLFIDGDWRDHVLTSLVNPNSEAPNSLT
jgi:[ribosomal protein S5]-alanine N-acetyltransferase